MKVVTVLQPMSDDADDYLDTINEPIMAMNTIWVNPLKDSRENTKITLELLSRVGGDMPLASLAAKLPPPSRAVRLHPNTARVVFTRIYHPGTKRYVEYPLDDIERFKVCANCSRRLNAFVYYPATPDFFHRDKTHADGMMSICVLCDHHKDKQRWKKRYATPLDILPEHLALARTQYAKHIQASMDIPPFSRPSDASGYLTPRTHKYKRCASLWCGRVFHRSEVAFAPDASQPDGLDLLCRRCRGIQRRLEAYGVAPAPQNSPYEAPTLDDAAILKAAEYDNDKHTARNLLRRRRPRSASASSAPSPAPASTQQAASGDEIPMLDTELEHLAASAAGTPGFDDSGRPF